jgi:hypothetical protein
VHKTWVSTVLLTDAPFKLPRQPDLFLGDAALASIRFTKCKGMRRMYRPATQGWTALSERRYSTSASFIDAVIRRGAAACDADLCPARR